MKVNGIIVEYNPFHNGHIYQINKVKEMYPNDILIIILNGYFTQRGEISVLTKEDKVKLAIEYGVDLVVELPTIYGIQASDIFAYQGVKILNELKIDRLIFGSESNDVNILKKIASIQESNDFNEKLKKELEKGISYPNALKNIINIDFEYLPNDLLGISYIKAINKINKNIEIITIKRTNDYHDINSNNEIISAKNIRNKYVNNLDIKNYTPAYNFIKIIDYDLYFKILKNKILTDSHLDEYVDVNEGIENRLLKYINDANNLKDYIELIKTKRYSYNKINRMLLHIVLGFKKNDNIDTLSIRILGFNNTGKEYLNKNKYKFEENKFIKNLELNFSKIYDLLTNSSTYQYEIKNIPIKK